MIWPTQTVDSPWGSLRGTTGSPQGRGLTRIRTFKFSWASMKITRVIFLIIKHVSVVIAFVGRWGWLAVCVQHRYTGM